MQLRNYKFTEADTRHIIKNIEGKYKLDLKFELNLI